MTDAVVIGSGPNGLSAANHLADAGWSVTVLEAADLPGGAVRTAELTKPGFHHDVFSAFYPLAKVSPGLLSLDLERWGLRWGRPDVAVAHVDGRGRVAAIGPTVDDTAASLEAWAPGDGDAWRRMFGRWTQTEGRFAQSLLTPFPPVRAAAGLARRVGPRELLELARLSVVPVRRLAEEEFGGEGAALLLAGNALHADLMPESAASSLFGWMLVCLAQDVGFPVPLGGAGRLTDALIARFTARGGTIRCGARVTGVEVRDGRAVAVRTADGDVVSVRRGVLADVPAPALYLDLVGAEHLPAALLHDLKRFQWDTATVKVDWALDGPVPWESDVAARAGTVHLADSLDDLTRWGAQLAVREVPEKPFVLFGQPGVVDPHRAPEGSVTAWGYTHVPRGVAVGEEVADRIELTVEQRAPGFRDRIIARHVLTPDGLEAANPSLVGGAINGGTAQLHQQLVFRPTIGWGRAETPIKGLFLASSSAHPGGGVHGACGANAARAAIAADRIRLVVRAVTGRAGK